MSKTEKIEVKLSSFFIIVNPNAKKTQLTGFDTKKNIYTMDVAEPSDNNKANEAIVKHLSKVSGRTAKILTGKTSKRKMIKLS